jgi:integrase
MSVKLREKKLSKGGISFYLDIYHNGRREYETLDIRVYPKDDTVAKKEKREIAQLARNNREIDLISNGYNYLPKHVKNIKFFDYAQSYLDNYSKKDIAMIDATIKRFKEYINNPKIKLNAINKKMLEGYTKYLDEEAGLSGESPQNYFARLKKIFKDAYDHGFISKNPADGIKFSKNTNADKIHKNVLDEAELKMLYKSECKYPELKKAFLFSCGTGLGLAEIHKLKWENIDNGFLKTKRSKNTNPVHFKLKDHLIKLIGKPKNPDDFVFNLINQNGEKMNNNSVNGRLEKWLKKVGIDKDITFYCGRHTFGTQLLIHGAELKTVSDLMSHSDIRTTLRYVNYIGELKNKAIDKLPDYEL